MLDEFDRARTHSHAQEIEVYHGHVAQAEVRKWLTDFLPKKFGVTSGYVISTAMSVEDEAPHYDIIIYDPWNSPVLWVEEHSGTTEHSKSLAIPVEHVFCVLEVKSRYSVRDCRKAMEHLGDLRPLLEREEASDLRYKTALPRNFSCGVIFFDQREEAVTSEKALETFIDGSHLRGFFGGLVLRSEAFGPEVSARIRLTDCDSAIEKAVFPRPANPLQMTKTVEGPPPFKHRGAAMCWTESSFTIFGFDLIARLQGTFDHQSSSNYAVGVTVVEVPEK